MADHAGRNPEARSLSESVGSTLHERAHSQRDFVCLGSGIDSGHDASPLLAPAAGHRIGYEREGCSRAIDVVLHRGRPAQPDRPDNFAVHLNGKPPTPRRHTRKRGDARQKRRVTLDEVEKVLRGDAEQSRVGLVLRNLDGRDRGPSIRLKALRLPPSSRIATFSVTPSSLAFATAASTIFCASSEEMLCFVTTSAIGDLPPLDGHLRLGVGAAVDS